MSLIGCWDYWGLWRGYPKIEKLVFGVRGSSGAIPVALKAASTFFAVNEVFQAVEKSEEKSRFVIEQMPCDLVR